MTYPQQCDGSSRLTSSSLSLKYMISKHLR